LKKKNNFITHDDQSSHQGQRGALHAQETRQPVSPPYFQVYQFILYPEWAQRQVNHTNALEKYILKHLHLYTHTFPPPSAAAAV
jgi:hypothetical protein